MKKFVTASSVLAIALCCAAGAVMGQSGSDDKVVAAYVRQLKDPDSTQRAMAADALGNMGPRAKDAVPDLIILLGSPSQRDRLSAVIALSKMGDAGRPALPELREAAADPDPTIAKVAKAAVDSLDPPASVVIKHTLWSTWFLSTVVVLVSALVAFFVVMRRRSSEEYRDDKKKKPAKPAEAAPVAVIPATPTEGSAPVASAKGAAAQPAAAQPQRKRVSRPIPGLADYVKEESEPDRVKRELTEAQAAFKKVTERQKELADTTIMESLTGDPERVRAVKKETDELSLQHYSASVRVKALEVKMLMTFLAQGIGGDQSLKERSEATLAQRWDELRTYCENPVKIWWRDGGWVSSPSGPVREIPDLREHLVTVDITLPDMPIPALPPSAKPVPASQEGAPTPTTEENPPAAVTGENLPEPPAE